MLIKTPRQAGLAVSAARRDLGLTQEQVAREADVSRQLVNKLEMGLATGISLTKLLAILNACGCTLAIDRMGAPKPIEPAPSKDDGTKPVEIEYDPGLFYPLDSSLFESAISRGEDA